VTIARRDTREKIAAKEDEAVAAVMGLLEEIQNSLFRKAKEHLEQNITAVRAFDELKEVLKNKGGFIKASWCSDSKCEEKIKEETGATIRVIASDEKPFSKCVYCGKTASEVVYFAKAY
jgi:prolyl-tRNA synthetase